MKRMMPDAPQNRNGVSRRVYRWLTRCLALPHPLLLAFDVDGTLAPIVEDPDAARVPRKTAGFLRALSRCPGVHVALVTGRDAKGLHQIVRVPDAWRALEHGRTILAPGEPSRKVRLDPTQRSRLRGFEAWARDHLVERGARIERKAAAVGIHTRNLASRDPAAATAVLRDAERQARRHGLLPRRGRAVVEAELEAGDKGHALLALQQRTGTRGVLYVGDDLTDMPAIREARKLGGIGLFVCSTERTGRPRDASGALQGPEEVAELIEALAERC